MLALPQVGVLLQATPGIHADYFAANAGVHPKDQGAFSAALRLNVSAGGQPRVTRLYHLKRF
jgi:hypothetical protein